MAAKKKTARSKRKLDWTKAKTYQELKEIANKLPRDRPPGENWAIMERMRQLRYGYKPGELKMDKSVVRTLRRSSSTFSNIARPSRRPASR